MLDTATLNERLAGKSEDAFLAEIEPLLPMAYRLAYGMLRRAEEAEDAVQEATINAWRRRGTFRAGSEMRPWFLAIVANQCRHLSRTRWWSVLRVAEPAAEAQEPPGAAAEELWQLRAALARLAPADRLVLVLRFYLDLTYEDVAATLRISPVAARVRTHRALARIRPKVNLSEEG